MSENNKNQKNQQNPLFKRIVSGLLGSFSWQPAPWMRNSSTAIKEKPSKFFLLVILLMGLLALAKISYDWYLSQPQDISFDATVTVPSIPAIENRNRSISPSAIRIKFLPNPEAVKKAEERAAKYDQYRQEIPKNALRISSQNQENIKGIQIEPFIEGKWWSDSEKLYFRPNKYWPAETKYTITFPESLFLDEVELSELKYGFTTKQLEAKFSNIKLHADDDSPAEKRVIGTISFTHPVAQTELENALKLSIRGRSNNNDFDTLDYELSSDTLTSQRRYFINSKGIPLSDQTQYVKVVLGGDLKSTTDTSYLSNGSKNAKVLKSLKDEISIPSIENFFKVENSQTQIVRDADDNPQQVLIVELTDKTTTTIANDYLEVYLLPPKDEDREWVRWNSASEIVPIIEEKAELLDVKLLPTEHKESKVFSMVFDAPENRQLFIKFKKGASSAGGYVANKDFRDVKEVPSYPKEVVVMGSGSILSREGDHQVGFVSRGVEQIRVRINQVRIDHINHLVTQTGGNFQDPNFNYSISAENLSVVTERVLPINYQSAGKPSYSSLDLSKELQNSEINSGLFYLEVIGEDQQARYLTQAQRMILITDIGFINKVNADRSQDIFAQSISRQQALAFASVSVLGKNGLSIFDTRTDERGHAKLPNFKDFIREQQPIAILVRNGDDMAYLPVNQYSQRVQTSRFDTGGTYWDANNENNLKAFLFTDRGIYRPGETARLGLIVKDHDLRAAPQFPVELTIENARGQTVYKKRHRLPKDGFFEANLETNASSATGHYHANLSLMEDDDYAKHLGSVSFQVEEFQPDRLKLKSKLQAQLLEQREDAVFSSGTVSGWLKPEGLAFDIQLDNLYGTPAQNRKVTSNYSLTRQGFYFSEYDGYQFYDSYNNAQGYNINESLPDTETDELGQANIVLDLEAYTTGTYQVLFDVQGFEESGGRSVRARNRVLVSPRDELIGLKSDSSLNYLKRNSKNNVELVCIDMYLQAKECAGLRLRKIEKRYVSTLVKQRNGTYQYQSLERLDELSNEDLVISADGLSLNLDTTKPGKYVYELLDASGDIRQKLHFQVVGAANLSAELEKDNQLEITLDKAEYEIGDWIELQLNAPYKGSGLISIETERTHHFTWFTADARQTTQRIQVPQGLQANAYVNVAFVRSLDSREVFTAPLSYAIAPLKLSRKPYELGLEMTVAEKAVPGEELTIEYRSEQAGRVALFAVDEGILQVAQYQTPDPLNTMLQKKALQVSSYQIFDLILPDFEVLRELSAAGGGFADEVMESGAAKNLNPFARKVKKPVVYWSGIVDVNASLQRKTFTIPDHFDGSLRVMAVAVSDDQFAHAQEKVIVRGPFIVSPNVPLVVAPGDDFEVTVGVSNQLEGSGENVPITVDLNVSKHVEVIGEPSQVLELSEGNEDSLRFKLKASEQLGSADIRFSASAETHNASRKADSTLSVRPAMPKNLSLKSGRFNSQENILELKRELLEVYAESKVQISNNPSLLIDGLISYLQVYPHACTEQIVSQVMPLVAFANHPNYLGTRQEKAKQLNSLFASLQQRQLSNGGFTAWASGNSAAQIPSVHTLHLLLEASNENLQVPSYLLEQGLEYLEDIAFDIDVMRSSPELAAYAIYLLTLSGEVTGSSLAQLEDILNENVSDQSSKRKTKWQEQLLGAYIAASYKLLKREDYALKLVRQYKYKNARTRINRYDSSLYRDAMAMYLLAKHFPEEFDPQDTSRIEALIEPVLSGNINTMSSGRTLMALNAYAKLFDGNDITQSVKLAVSKLGEESWRDVNLQKGSTDALYASSELAFDDAKIRVQNLNNVQLYYQTLQNGFDRRPPSESLSNGLEVDKRIFDAKTKEEKTEFVQGDDVVIVIGIRSTNDESHDDIAIVDLLPGGFEIDIEETRSEIKYPLEYTDIREDRYVMYLSVAAGKTLNISYKARVSTSGEFIVPPVYANAMYDEQIVAHSTASKVTVLPGR